MNILIIGSKGFIGSHCTKYFSKNNKVWECDVVTDYVSKNYFIVDATNADYSEVFQTQKFDVCINCSGASSVGDSLTKPQRDYTLNTVNVYKQLDAIRRFNPECKFVNLSSAAVYGNPKSLPINENHEVNPISPYGTHKKMAEDICELFYKQFNIASCSLRIFSAYGEGLKKQLFWDLHKKDNSQNEVVLYGTGIESRDFIHVQDIINALECVMAKGSFTSEVINIANGIELEINKVANLFFKYYKKGTLVKFGKEERKGDPMNWLSDISLLKKLGYKQTISIEEGLKKYVVWLKENVSD